MKFEEIEPTNFLADMGDALSADGTRTPGAGRAIFHQFFRGKESSSR